MTSVTKDGEGVEKSRTVTTYTPSAKDRIAALEKLAEYGQVEGREKGSGGGGADLPTMIRALAAVMADPVTRRNLMQDPRIGDTLRLLAAEPVEVVTATEVLGADGNVADGAGT